MNTRSNTHAITEGNFFPYKITPQPNVKFSPTWTKFFDEIVPNAVKQKYSPKENWRSRPFGEPDVHFFKRGVMELSDIFTVERDRRIHNYFQHARFRSGYLLYFLPLHAAKFYLLFQRYAEGLPWESWIKKNGRTRPFVIKDLGAGPATASIAALIYFAERFSGKIPFDLQFQIHDQNREILEDGRELLSQLILLLKLDPKRIEIQTIFEPSKNSRFGSSRPSSLKSTKPDLFLMGNVLNEGSLFDFDRTWMPTLEHLTEFGAVFIEPSTRKNSQLLSQLRDAALERLKTITVRGPCLHQLRCPLAEGRDWCHFSVPLEIPCQWFKAFSKAMGSERQWSKLSYLWLFQNPEKNPSLEKSQLTQASQAKEIVSTKKKTYRVVSDTFQHDGSPHVLLCAPERTKRVQVSFTARPNRGDLIKLDESKPIRYQERPDRDDDEREFRRPGKPRGGAQKSDEGREFRRQKPVGKPHLKSLAKPVAKSMGGTKSPMSFVKKLKPRP